MTIRQAFQAHCSSPTMRHEVHTGCWVTHAHAELLKGNHRMAQPLAGLARLNDPQGVVEPERPRGGAAS